MHEILINEMSKKPKKMRGKVYIERNNCPVGDYLAADWFRHVGAPQKRLFLDSVSDNERFFSLCDGVENKVIPDDVNFIENILVDEIEDEMTDTQEDAQENASDELTEDAGEDDADNLQEAECRSLPLKAKGVFTIDCMDERYKNADEQSAALERLSRFCERFGKTGGVCVFIIPEPECCPKGITSLAEREYDAYLLNKGELTDCEEFYLKLEEVIRNSCSAGCDRLTLLRGTNVLGSECMSAMHGIDLKGIIDEIKEEKTITICQGDQVRYISLVSVFDIMITVNYILRTALYPKGKSYYWGHTFNFGTYKASIYQLKQTIYNYMPDKITLKNESLEPAQTEYRCLNARRIQYLVRKKNKGSFTSTLKEQLYRMVCYSLGEDYDITRKLSVYEGRLEVIKSAEIKLLGIIDKICRENNIKYFATAGTMLGVVRHNGMIPWDDDIDIGMLRKDFEKFREICPSQLPEGVTYERANGESGSHYHFDRIRLSGTFFSTFYSDNFIIPDGIFVDIVVYDPTSNIQFLQKAHIRLVVIWTRVINVKWVNRIRKGIHPKMTKIALPFMRRISWNWFHNMFDVIAKWYRKKKNPTYVIDTMGLYIKKGPLKAAWFEDTVDIPFEDLLIPVPAGYEECLVHFYGPHWNELLPVDKRISGHKIARIDLGSYIFDNELHKDKRPVNLAGELYETIND